MKNIGIVFPNQLFDINNITYPIDNIDIFLIVEDTLFFADEERKLNFNLLKLIFQRASMKYYQSYLVEKGYKVAYIEYDKAPDFWYKGLGNAKLYFIDPIDHLLESRIEKFSRKYGLEYEIFESNMFLTELDDLDEYFQKTKKTEKYYQYNFYIWQRKRLGILMDGDKPIGGKYSFDKENRKGIPGKSFNKFIEDNDIKYPMKKYDNSYYPPAIKYCEKTFKNINKVLYDPGSIYLYPITHVDTLAHFRSFLRYKLKYFGTYQDAMSADSPFLFHSVISPQLNNGLITPAVILRMVMRAYDKETSNKVRISILPTIEGYIRQLNWREYSRMLYICAYKEMRGNYFGNSRRLSKEWYEAKTGIEPVDAAITCAFKYGYLHHIVRLMVICNFMNLCGVRPYDAYCWFMEFSLDSYDWVMINNVYSMGMFADGGLTTTKAYISGGNYIKNMSDITVGDWAKKWTILYYYFIYRNYALLDGRSTIYKSQWDKYEDKEMIKREGKRLMLGLTSS